MIYFSPSTKGFYRDGVHTEGQIPGDRVEISDELHQQLIAGQGQGKVIVAGTGGVPELRDAPGPTTDQALANLRATRDNKLAGCDWTQGGDTPLTTSKVTAWKNYRQALRDLPANTADPNNPSWPTPPA